MKSISYFTPVRIVFWIMMMAILSTVGFLWAKSFHDSSHGSDKAGCVMQQRNLQQAVRSYQNANSLKPGDPIDWTKIIGPGLFIERTPVCPIHGASAYTYAATIPPEGVLVAPCKDPKHKPPSTSSW